jgi:tRNA(fMet)-specific endonuclease VapC
VKPADVPDGPLLVDTGVFSWVTWSRQRHAEFTALMLNHILVLSFATIAELRYGALKVGWGPRNVQILEQKIATYLAITATDLVTRKWAELYQGVQGSDRRERPVDRGLRTGSA